MHLPDRPSHPSVPLSSPFPSRRDVSGSLRRRRRGSGRVGDDPAKTFGDAICSLCRDERLEAAATLRDELISGGVCICYVRFGGSETYSEDWGVIGGRGDEKSGGKGGGTMRRRVAASVLRSRNSFVGILHNFKSLLFPLVT